MGMRKVWLAREADGGKGKMRIRKEEVEYEEKCENDKRDRADEEM